MRDSAVLITGSTGLVGGHLLVRLYTKKWPVKALIREQASCDQLKTICSFYQVPFDDLYRSIDWITGDTLDYIGLKKALQGIETVFHVAGKVSFSKKDAAQVMAVNVQGTANMVDAALANQVNRFCFISSVAALGDAQNGHLINESTPRDTNRWRTAYSESKYRSELEIIRGAAEGLKVAILNPGVILGPGLTQKGSMQLFQLASLGLPFYLDYTTGYVDVRDVAQAAIEVIEQEAFLHHYILVSANLSLKELFTRIALESGKKPPFIKIGHPLEYGFSLISPVLALFSKQIPVIDRKTIRQLFHSESYDNRLIQQELGFHFTPIEKTIRDTVRFDRQRHTSC
jgi:nucleoside-diphosphate-sugar epimerase